MKKVLVALCLIVFLFCFSACGKLTEPELAVKDFIETYKTFDTEAIHACFAPGQETVAQKTDINLIPLLRPTLIEYLTKNASVSSYKFGETVLEGDRAVVTLNFSSVEDSGLMQDALFDFISQGVKLGLSKTSGTTDEEMAQVFLDEFTKPSRQSTKRFEKNTVNITCIQIDGVWKIYDFDESLLKVMTSNTLSLLNGITVVFGG